MYLGFGGKSRSGEFEGFLAEFNPQTKKCGRSLTASQNVFKIEQLDSDHLLLGGNDNIDLVNLKQMRLTNKIKLDD